MRHVLWLAMLAACSGVSMPVTAHDTTAAIAPLPGRIVIAHRGASALRPEHTLEAYAKAIEDGADAIEPDIVITKDGVLVARHENEISGTTNVADKPEFADRKTTKRIDNVAVTGWFTEDFTLAELKTLGTVERIPDNRPDNTRFNGQFAIPTLQEIIDLARTRSVQTRRTIAIYPETKHPSYVRAIGLPLERRLVDLLHANGYHGRHAPVFIQSFEVSSLKEMRAMTELRLIQLMSASGQPEDFRLAGDKRRYRDLASAAGLQEVATYANGIGPSKDMVIPRDGGKNLSAPTDLVRNAHAVKLLVHPYTFRPENPFLPMNLRQNDATSLSQRGDLAAEIKAFLRAGVNGVFTEDPATGRAALDGESGR